MSTYRWERVADGVYRCRLPFLDVTVGAVTGRDGVVLIDSGTTLAEAGAIADDVRGLDPRGVTDLVLTHHHFDHVLGCSVFADARTHCADEVLAALRDAGALAADAVSYGADAAEIAATVAALRPLNRRGVESTIDLGDRVVTLLSPGRGHTGHDLVVVVPGAPTVVFCGDLVEESGDPAIADDSHPAEWADTLDVVLAAGGPDARYVPGHGAVVDADFVRRQRDWLRQRVDAD
ncbi:MBL fold metallo-hydrolase [Mycolicibacterium arenosum]|uniref:MBL fold metallo-hydrolase n=1 Tax=Mycolicibacterium arenosum TaxID=2952157 RepID=A0ABT1LYD9_9MYCO|nr:MBL fold metallo-hydrolase [Mycolicibacterium sp. CAU 1645]MCP9271913.1 MBL fold metallo-hydrolase [Mycolicibacterium sp. CAU 1645]